ncbi:glutathione S-transferase family protein [Sagittula sp. S175]|uniref:glutathione S-transferase family protein n=1 Tax=Sagittula sp. S175 TaxID=3415129 RepID=UPI003C7E1A4F
MTLVIYGHPFSSHCWKVYIAARERGLDWEDRTVDPTQPEHQAFCRAAGPGAQFPALLHGEVVLVESAVIIEYLDGLGEAAPMVPAGAAALEARQMDALFDDYLMAPVGRLVLDALRPEAERDPVGMAAIREKIQAAYVWFEDRMAGRDWAAGAFGMADCAAAPALFYAHWVEPIPEGCQALRAYRRRLLARPSVAATVDGGRFFRPYFPVKGLADPDLG